MTQGTTYQDGRVVKALDLRANRNLSAWVQTPLLVVALFLIRAVAKTVEPSTLLSHWSETSRGNHAKEY